MSKTILVTGSTDGIGLVTAKMLVAKGHKVIVHGRSHEKVEKVMAFLKENNRGSEVDGFVADFSSMTQVENMAEAILNKYDNIDILINNAGVFVAQNTITEDGLELRFAVNTIAPYLLTKLLRPIINDNGRIINLSSAAQSSVDLKALGKATSMSNDSAYAQSKLAITMWSIKMAQDFMKEAKGPSVVAVNPKSFLGSKMVREAYKTEGHDLSIGGDILCRLALDDEFENASGKYFDNDRGIFSMPHPDALDSELRDEVVNCLDEIIAKC